MYVLMTRRVMLFILGYRADEYKPSALAEMDTAEAVS